MKIIKYQNLEELKKETFFNRQNNVDPRIKKVTQEIVTNIKLFGDEYIEKIEQNYSVLKRGQWRVTKKELEQAFTEMSKEFKQQVRLSMSNQKAFQDSILIRKTKKVSPINGVTLQRIFVPLDRVGIYIPAGNASYPSSLIMTAWVAILAGVKNITVYTPSKNGYVNPNILAVAKMVGVDEIYKIGGAQSISAMCYGTDTIRKVQKIFGAGNSYVTEAKLAIMKDCAIDLPAGPSEVMIIASSNNDPAWIAADLLSQCEHGIDSAAVLITDDELFAKKVMIDIEKQTKNILTKEVITKSLDKNGAIIVNKELSDSWKIANEFAPEHLEISCSNQQKILKKIKNVGCIFLGKYSSEPVGDYMSGGNHVLPTNQYAKVYSGLSIECFGKFIEVQEISKNGLKKLKKGVDEFAKVEGLPAHANAVDIRFKI